MKITLTGIIEKEKDGYVALCPEVDVASQGETVDDARKNLTEALQLFFEYAHEAEIKQRLSAPLIDVSSGIRNAF
ncbi:type II toxin-antitoxin system HicB family antitoxin [Candidatus Spongiihabitans sp.]|uniref:type II toxin-antitoxin system HicB family antitoxin n=1 Tax=Candidatus Spongiihabitans sp. TaxID=3101308 RepID=UPI003C7DD112